MNGRFTVAAVQAAYVLLDRDATVARVEELVAEAAGLGAELVVFPEAFIPGTPLWIDSTPIWDGDGPWYARLVEQAVIVPGPVTARLGAIARTHRVHLVIGVQEREPHGSHHLQHRSLLRIRRPAADQAPQAGAHRLRAHRVGAGGRLDPRGRPDPPRAARWTHLLGELHAPGALPPVRAGCGGLAGADVGPRRRLGGHHAAHRTGRPGVGRGREPRPASRPDPPRPARPAIGSPRNHARER